MSINLQRERAYYLAHHDILSQLYDGHFIVIKGEVVIGAYDDAAWAALKTRKRFAGGAFLVEKVAAGSHGGGHAAR